MKGTVPYVAACTTGGLRAARGRGRCARRASPPLIAATAAPALAIAFWRTGAAALVIAPAVLVRRERYTRRGVLLAVLAGFALAAHFGTFIPSLSYTSVASATALVCSQAVWAGLFGRAAGGAAAAAGVARHRGLPVAACC